ncbi:hypothetical protein [Haliangium sp.]|uniref:hypothetical protein n=2 Tax=Haliangium sp. TaxID=2663208 RepID=UPI003D14A8D1
MMLSTLLVVLLSALPRPALAAADAVPGQTQPHLMPAAAPPFGPGLVPASAQPVPPAGPVTPAPATAAADAAAAADETERALAQVEAARRARARAAAEKTRLAEQYERELQALDRLKQQRPSWRRDRLIRDQLRAAHDTAAAVAAAEKRVHGLDDTLRRRERALVAAIERELAAGPAPERRQSLLLQRRAIARHLRPDAKKIVLPDQRIDPLADPEDLDHQAALIRESERELAAELARLERQADRYRYMATLGAKRARADEFGRFDDDQPRRTAGQTKGRVADNELSNGGGSPAPGSPDAPPSENPPPDDRGEPPGEFDPVARFEVVLEDVVDSPTLTALRAADRSGSPAVRARAVEQAAAQVRARLDRLRSRRSQIQDRAERLRR